eukprot:CAMPEP_0175067060 /NCGR_PEP_ID=MMETSP0052_2-20121109/16874_1 /TAXON_ID=51329 ORGANISM="Polytomella parva, Strain SAG 63-3" /NCGR_SAMPLE_ID=MMETSP0052_2 /ASSEMBLY_ACC=CAM_ASM_000194 /LENGTH=322 /DNA_ID=CAMNT_0016333871 /DNA_START=90 /DNA_END=1055 /DNA_ORIENTATION=-
MSRNICTLPYPDKYYAAERFWKIRPAGSKTLSEESQLLLYALHQQISLGPNNSPKPWAWSIVEVTKWQGWKDLGQMSSSEAMRLFVMNYDEEQPDWWELLQKHEKSGESSIPASEPIVTAAGSSPAIMDSNDVLSLFPSSDHVSAPYPYSPNDVESTMGHDGSSGSASGHSESSEESGSSPHHLSDEKGTSEEANADDEDEQDDQEGDKEISEVEESMESEEESERNSIVGNATASDCNGVRDGPVAGEEGGEGEERKEEEEEEGEEEKEGKNMQKTEKFSPSTPTTNGYPHHPHHHRNSPPPTQASVPESPPTSPPPTSPP